MKKLLLLMALLPTGLPAQSIDTYKTRLQIPTENASILLVEHGDATDVVRNATLKNRSSRLSGYRIGVFFDNSNEARGRALAAREKFATEFPTIPTYLTYETPYFRVMAGNFATSEEAIILLESVRKFFPDAYLMREEMGLSEI